MKISPARVAAFDVLLQIERKAAFSSVLLPKYEEELNAKDRGLCHEIVLGVLRRKLFLDANIDTLSKGKRIDTEVRIVLRIGLFQLIYLDRVPAHSAINESVELAGRAKKTSAKGFVNAILRSFLRVRPNLSFADDVEELSIESSHPRWLVERWVRQFGREVGELICNSNNQTPKTAFRIIGDCSLVTKVAGFVESRFVPGCFIADRLNKELIDLAWQGAIYFQDEASQLVAQVVIEAGGNPILDVCAAPGGKTSMIALATKSNIIAGDIHFARIERLRETCSEQSANVQVVQIDAEFGLPFEKGSFETVFVDAPCSGTGTIRHNPEIRYSITDSDIEDLSSKQLTILRNASDLVADGGNLIYSTCSIEMEENEGVCEKFLAGNDDFTVVPINTNALFLTDDGFARTFQHRDDMDGFFIARFLRR